MDQLPEMHNGAKQINSVIQNKIFCTKLSQTSNVLRCIYMLSPLKLEKFFFNKTCVLS